MGRTGNSSSALTNNPNIPVEIARALRSLEQRVIDLSAQVSDMKGQLSNKLGASPDDLRQASKVIRDELQANGSAPLSVTRLPGMQAGDLTEATSDVFTITNGKGAVFGTGTSIEVKKATAAQDGYLTKEDWASFNGKEGALAYTPLNPANNLNDVADVPTARNNLGLGSAATHAASDFDAAGAATTVQSASLQKSANLSDLTNAGTARANLGLGSAATQPTSAFDASGAAAAAVASVPNATSGTTGYLTAADWVTFNGKQAALGFTPLNPANNLSELANAGTARTNLGLGTAATHPATDFQTALGYTPLNAASNLSDLANASTARTNLGLGSAATQATSAFDAAGAASTAQAASLQKTANLSDLADAPTARTNLGLGSAATQATSAFDAAGAASTAQAASLQKSSNLSDLANAGTARTNLAVPGLNTANTWIATGVTNLQQFQSTLATGFCGIYLQNDGTPFISARCYGSTATTVLAGITLANWCVLYHNFGNGMLIETVTSVPIVFGTNNVERMRLVGAGRLLIGTTTDNASDLVQVNGAVNATSYKSGASTGVASATVTLAKLTTGGVNGSLTVTNGLITAITNPT